MKDAGTIAFFIKYLDREDLNLAQEKFRQALGRLPDETRSFITELFEEAASEYDTPLVDLEQLELGREASHDGIIDEVIAKKDDPKLSKDMQLVAEITGRWMRFMKDSGNPPMTPHHVQIYCVLMLVNFYKRRAAAWWVEDFIEDGTPYYYQGMGSGSGSGSGSGTVPGRSLFIVVYGGGAA